VRQTLALEKRRRTAPAPRSPQAPVVPRLPAPVVAAAPPAPVRIKPELSKIAPRMPNVPRLPAANPAPRKRVLSEQRLAQIDRDLAAAIDRDRAGIDPLNVPSGPQAEPKHFATEYVASLSTGDRSHHGLCDPVQNWRDGDWDYYYVVCNVRFSDGSYQRQGVPWPVRFNPRDDPFNGTARDERALAMPLPGWHLGPGQTVSPELRDYAREHGVEL